MDIAKEINRRFVLQNEYLGTEKPVNKITPLVSVTVAAYQHENYIKKCLDGILIQQTNFPFEIIIGEDDSKDKTRAICIDYANKYQDKIRLFLRDRKLSHLYDHDGNFIKRLNGVLGFSRMSAKGKYIALCEGDDYWTDQNKLQKQVDILENNQDFSGCFHKTLTINETDKKPKLVPFREYNKQIFTFEDTISKKALFHTSSFLFRSHYCEYEEGYLKIHSADMLLFSTIAKKGKLFLINDFMSVYRLNENGVTRKINNKEYHQKRIALMDYLIKISEEKYFDSITEVKNYHISNLNVNQKKSKYNVFDHNHFYMKVFHKVKKILSVLLRNKTK